MLTQSKDVKDGYFRFRLSKRLLDLAEVAARAQGISLSRYLETLLEADLTQVPLPEAAQDDPFLEHIAGIGRRAPFVLGDIAEYLWDEDDAQRFLKRMQWPWCLSAEHRRLRELVMIVPAFKEDAGFANNVASHWQGLNQLLERGATTDFELLRMLDGLDFEFVLMSEAQRVRLHKEDGDAFLLRARAVHEYREQHK